MSTTFTKSALAGLAGVMALTAAVSAPSLAAAQSTPYYADRGYSYDPCRRDSTNRGTAGALLGGALGAVIGSNAAARNARTEGALLGGALGAVGGAVVGKNSAACQPAPYQPRTTYYNDRPYGGGYSNNRYDQAPAYQPAPPPPPPEPYAYDQRGDRYTVSERPPSADGCTLAESPIYLPDGTTQKRFVRVCQDSRGRYQVVD